MKWNLFRIIPVYIILLSSCCYGQSREIKNYLLSGPPVDFRKDTRFTEDIDLRNPDTGRLQVVVFLLTNEVRARHRLSPLAYSAKLELTAQMHAEDMVKEKFFSHINSKNPSKKTPNDRARLNQISNPYLAENIIEAYGLRYTSNRTVYLQGKGMFSYEPNGELLKPHTYLSLGESMVNRWMNSREHRKNILSRDAVQMGCGNCFYIDAGFNDMPSCKAVQNFQWFQVVR